MIRLFFILIALTSLPAHALDYTQLGAVKRLTADKRYDEAIQKLEALAAKTDEPGENFHYLELALDITVKSLKSAERSLALAAKVKDAAHRDFATLRVLAAFDRHDEALASVQGKDINDWPVRCRGAAHGILAEIYHAKKDSKAELQQWLEAADSPGAELVTHGRALCEAAELQLKFGNAAQAEQQLRKAVALTPANYAWRVEALVTLSRLLIEQQRSKEALKVFDGTDFTKVTSVTPRGNLIEAHARALLAAGKKIRAIETFDQLLQLDLPATWKDRINKELDRMAEDF